MSKKLRQLLDSKYGWIAFLALGVLLMCIAFGYSIFILGCLPGQICISVP